MIVDVHTHIAEYPCHIGARVAEESRRAWSGTQMPVVDEEVVEGIIQRDSLELLGLPVP